MRSFFDHRIRTQKSTFNGVKKSFFELFRHFEYIILLIFYFLFILCLYQILKVFEIELYEYFKVKI